MVREIRYQQPPQMTADRSSSNLNAQIQGILGSTARIAQGFRESKQNQREQKAAIERQGFDAQFQKILAGSTGEDGRINTTEALRKAQEYAGGLSTQMNQASWLGMAEANLIREARREEQRLRTGSGQGRTLAMVEAEVRARNVAGAAAEYIRSDFAEWKAENEDNLGTGRFFETYDPFKRARDAAEELFKAHPDTYVSEDARAVALRTIALGYNSSLAAMNDADMADRNAAMVESGITDIVDAVVTGEAVFTDEPGSILETYRTLKEEMRSFGADARTIRDASHLIIERLVDEAKTSGSLDLIDRARRLHDQFGKFDKHPKFEQEMREAESRVYESEHRRIINTFSNAIKVADSEDKFTNLREFLDANSGWFESKDEYSTMFNTMVEEINSAERSYKARNRARLLTFPESEEDIPETPVSYAMRLSRYETQLEDAVGLGYISRDDKRAALEPKRKKLNEMTETQVIRDFANGALSLIRSGDSVPMDFNPAAIPGDVMEEQFDNLVGTEKKSKPEAAAIMFRLYGGNLRKAKGMLEDLHLPAQADPTQTIAFIETYNKVRNERGGEEFIRSTFGEAGTVNQSVIEMVNAGIDANSIATLMQSVEKPVIDNFKKQTQDVDWASIAKTSIAPKWWMPFEGRRQGANIAIDYLKGQTMFWFLSQVNKTDPATAMDYAMREAKSSANTKFAAKRLYTAPQIVPLEVKVGDRVIPLREHYSEEYNYFREVIDDEIFKTAFERVADPSLLRSIGFAESKYGEDVVDRMKLLSPIDEGARRAASEGFFDVRRVNDVFVNFSTVREDEDGRVMVEVWAAQDDPGETSGPLFEIEIPEHPFLWKNERTARFETEMQMIREAGNPFQNILSDRPVSEIEESIERRASEFEGIEEDVELIRDRIRSGKPAAQTVRDRRDVP